jgi:nucleoid-associated protein YgaU
MLLASRDPTSPLFKLQPNDFAPLINVSAPPSIEDKIEGALLLKAPREHGSTKIEEISDSALQRWRVPAASLPEHALYRPASLTGATSAIEANPPPAQPQSEHQKAPTSTTAKAGTLYKVLYGDTLSALAFHVYGHASRVDIILKANLLITDADRISIGEFIYLPEVSVANGEKASSVTKS